MMMFFVFGSQGLDYRAYINTYMQYKRKLGLYIKYFHTVKSASGAESSRVNMV